MKVAFAIAFGSHFFWMVLLLGGAMNILEGWGSDFVAFAIGLLQLGLCIGFTWLTADAYRVTREARR